jgi:hypothetical protein
MIITSGIQRREVKKGDVNACFYRNESVKRYMYMQYPYLTPTFNFATIQIPKGYPRSNFGDMSSR